MAQEISTAERFYRAVAKEGIGPITAEEKAWLRRRGDVDRALAHAQTDKTELRDDIQDAAGEIALFRKHRQEFAIHPPTAVAPPSGLPPGVFVPTEEPRLVEGDGGVSAVRFRLPQPDDESCGQPLFQWTGWQRADDFDPRVELARFVRLDTPEEVLGFARDAGPLLVCDRHGPRCLWSGLPWDIEHTWGGIESMDSWIGAVAALRGALNASAKLRDGRPLATEDREAFGAEVTGYGLGLSDDTGFPPLYGDWVALQWHVQRHIQAYGPDLKLEVHPSRRELGLGFVQRPGFLPALWKQALVEMAGATALSSCSGCALPYFRTGRAAKRGQRNYCPDCPSSVRMRLSRRSRQG
jgi:hypothetical protein